ncbi:MAG: AMP-dependent synthetase/ligase [Promethearchaeota archaeon]
MKKITKDTISIIRFLLDSARKLGDLDCMRYLKRGEYVGITWNEVLDVTRWFALGFQSLGINHEDRVALMSKTRYEWRLVDYGIMFAGGTTVTIYPSLTTSQVEYIVNDSNSVILVVDGKRNLNKALKAKKNCLKLKYIISIEPLSKDMISDELFGLDELIEKGQDFYKSNSKLIPEKLQRKINKLMKKLKRSRQKNVIEEILQELHDIDFLLAKDDIDPFIKRYLEIKEEQIATIVYTSGTTGVPKGAMLTHFNMAINSIQTEQVIPLKQHDIALSFLPLSHVLERQVGQFIATLIGFTVAYARDTDSLIENLDQVKPTFITSVPRIYEKLYDRIIADVISGGERKQKIFDHAVDWGYEYQTKLQEGEEISITTALKNWIADKLVFKKVHDIIGGRLRFMFSGGAALNPVIARFYFACGFKIMEGYGLTETSPVLTVNRLDKIRFGTVGPPIPDTEVRIAEDGEIIAKGPQVFKGYWNKPAENAAAFDDEGFYHTGDLGEFTEEGYLKITGRKKTVIVLRTGKKVSPVVTEATIALDRHVAHACVIGDDLKYLIGIIEPNFEYLGEWLEEQGLTNYKPEDFEIHEGMTKEEFKEVMARRQKVIEMPEVQAFYNQILEETQKNLSSFEKVKRFALVADEWNEYNVLTPSLKMKRTLIKERYKDLIEKIYVE